MNSGSGRNARNRLMAIGGGLLLGLLTLWFIFNQLQGEDLPFETISRGDGFYTGRSYGKDDPNLLIISTPAEIDQPGLDIQFAPTLATQLHGLDYNRYFAVLVLQGLRGVTRPGETIAIQQIKRQNNQIIIKATFPESAVGKLVLPAFSSPYHLVAVSKQTTWGQPIHFALFANNRRVTEIMHVIP